MVSFLFSSFIFKVSTCFKRLNGKINRADIEFRLRLERIKVRLEEHKKDTLIELITNVHDNFKRYVEEERKKGKRGDAPIFNSFVKQVWILINGNLLIKTISAPLLRNTENWLITCIQILLTLEHVCFRESMWSIARFGTICSI